MHLTFVGHGQPKDPETESDPVPARHGRARHGLQPCDELSADVRALHAQSERRAALRDHGDHGRGAHLRRAERPRHGQHHRAHPHPLGQVQALARDRHPHDLGRDLRDVQRQAAGLELRVVLRRDVFPLQHHLHDARHCLLGHGAGAELRREHPQPAHLPRHALCRHRRRAGGVPDPELHRRRQRPRRQRRDGLRSRGARGRDPRPRVSGVHGLRRQGAAQL